MGLAEVGRPRPLMIDQSPLGDGRVKSLDGIRGIAMLVVMAAHLTPPPHAPSALAEWVYSTLAVGLFGLDMFFVLSGFLITTILLDSLGSPHYARNFFARRVLRIVPLYYGCLMLVFVVVPRIAPGAVNQALLDRQIYLWTYTSNIYDAWRRGWAFHGSVNLDHLWSLSIEEHYYLGWPFIVWFSSRRGLVRVALALALTSLVLRLVLAATLEKPLLVNYVFTPCRLDGMGLGSALGVVARDPAMLARLARLARPLLLPLGIVTLSVSIPPIPWMAWVNQTVGTSIFSLFAAALIIVGLTAVPGTQWNRALTAAPLRTFGKYSYAIYVVHVILAKPVQARVWGLFGERYALVIFASNVVGGALSLGLAYASWHLYESQWLKLKRYF